MRLEARQAYTSNGQFCRVLRVIEAFRVGQAPKSDQETLRSFGAGRRPGWVRPRRATGKHCVPSGREGVPGGSGPEKRPGSIAFLRGGKAPRVGQAPKNNREAGVAEPYTPIENMNEIDR